MQTTDCIPGMVNALFTASMRSRETPPVYPGNMDFPFILDRLTLADAADLIDRFGEKASGEASARANVSRDAGNVVRFCHWRQIERVIAVLGSGQAHGTVH